MKKIKDVYPKDADYIKCPYCGDEINVLDALEHCTWSWEAVKEKFNLYEATYTISCPHCQHDVEVAECYKKYYGNKWLYAYLSVYRGKLIPKEV